jgi:hypothetical protein
MLSKLCTTVLAIVHAQLQLSELILDVMDCVTSVVDSGAVAELESVSLDSTGAAASSNSAAAASSSNSSSSSSSSKGRASRSKSAAAAAAAATATDSKAGEHHY